MPDILTTQEIPLPPSVRIQWIHEGRLVIITLKNSSREAIDAWVKITIELMKIWEEDKPYLVLHDVSGAVLTPYARQRAMETADVNPALRGRYALVVANGFVGHAIAMFYNRDLRNKQNAAIPHLVGQAFTKRDEALRWLEELLPL